MSFQSFSLDPRILAGIAAVGYTEPTPIQQRAIPTLLQGSDVVGVAQTGTGKTAAFVLPILERLIDGPRGSVRALIIVPTRELADQIHQAVGVLGRGSGLRSAGQGAGGVAEGAGVVLQAASASEVAFDGVAQAQERVVRFGCGTAGCGAEMGRVQHEDGEQVAQQRAVNVQR